jgi:hypothetical protein
VSDRKLDGASAFTLRLRSGLDCIPKALPFFSDDFLTKYQRYFSCLEIIARITQSQKYFRFACRFCSAFFTLANGNQFRTTISGMLRTPPLYGLTSEEVFESKPYAQRN